MRRMASGRPVSFWMRFDFIEDIDDAAEAENMTRSQYVIRGIHASLNESAKRAKKGPEQAN